ncbi:PIN domain-containing protein [Verrucomicrobiota bacterium sgz303538]
MTPKLTVTLLRALFVVLTTYIGAMVGETFPVGALSGAATGMAFGLTVVLADRMLKGVSLRIFSSASFGLLVGTLFAKLLLASDVLRSAPEDVRWVSSLVLYATFAYLGMMLALRSNRDEFALIIPYVRFRQAREQGPPVIVDSNIIIDGRLAAICATGFLTNSLVIPRFVLEELQRLADSADPLKRERGRLALERLQQIQRTPTLQISIHESDTAELPAPTDTKLVQLAQLLDARLLTNDSNLCALARLQGVTALNLNELSQSLRPALNTGDTLELTLSKEGREGHQAVGYLSDGTMIVVNHARAQLGRTVPVMISGTVQTNAGRLLFGELKEA